MSAPDRGSSPRRLPAGRKAALAAHVAEVGQVTVAELSERFGVSIDTVRRDLDELDGQGVLTRTHGGAVSAADALPIDRGLNVRLRFNTEEKEVIARLAAELVKDGDVIMINGGTTALALARALREHRELTIATNNLRLPGEISPKVLRDLYVFGGSVRTVTQATTGHISFASNVRGADVDVRCDLALIAVGAVAPDGFTTSNLGDAVMMGEMVDRAQRTAILADHSKFDRRLFAQATTLDKVDYFVTDRRPEGALLAAFEQAGVQVIAPGSGEALPR